MSKASTRFLYALCGSLLLSATGCRSIDVRTDYDPAIDFAIFGSYAWLSPPPSPPAVADDAIVPTNELLEPRIQMAVDAELRARGLPRVDAPDADLLVAAHVSFDQDLRISTTTRGFEYHDWSCHMKSFDQTLVAPYDEGSFVIDFVDPVERRLVWRGVGRVQLRDGTPQERATRVRATAAAILEGFPPTSPR